MEEARRHRVTKAPQTKTPQWPSFVLPKRVRIQISKCSQTQEAGTVINPIWHVLRQSETETQFPKMTCQKSHSKNLEALMENLGLLAQQSREYGPC